jgi:hypothetical protein
MKKTFRAEAQREKERRKEREKDMLLSSALLRVLCASVVKSFSAGRGVPQISYLIYRS